jgi:hypothetical protein
MTAPKEGWFIVLLAIAGVLLNLALLAGAVWVVVWVLRATGVIG